jgi:hypothetical protein
LIIEQKLAQKSKKLAQIGSKIQILMSELSPNAGLLSSGKN